MGWFSKKDKAQEEVPASSGHVSSSPVPAPSSLPPPGFKEASDHDKLVTEKLGAYALSLMRCKRSTSAPISRAMFIPVYRAIVSYSVITNRGAKKLSSGRVNYASRN